MKINKKAVLSKLNEVLDPELNISIVDLGLVYDVILEKDSLKIIMTLTTIGCPLISLIEGEVKNKLGDLGFEDSRINVELTFDPPWSMDKMSERAKAMLGIG